MSDFKRKAHIVYMTDADFDLCAKVAGHRGFSSWAMRTLVAAATDDKKGVSPELKARMDDLFEAADAYSKVKNVSPITKEESMGLFAPPVPPPLPTKR